MLGLYGRPSCSDRNAAPERIHTRAELDRLLAAGDVKAADVCGRCTAIEERHRVNSAKRARGDLPPPSLSQRNLYIRPKGERQ